MVIDYLEQNGIDVLKSAMMMTWMMISYSMKRMR